MKTKSASLRINVATKLRFFYSHRRSADLMRLSGRALAAGKIAADVSGAIPAASALPLTIIKRSLSSSQL